ncbi:MAG: hypothetical protein JSS49_27265 [Planctomycetes bacterium]|nr:hypothetical protein [Planctomycetota bacterium]
MSLAVFAGSAALISVRQADYVNADFVAYSTVAHRVIGSPANSVTGSWSPLFSWLMVPLLTIGIQDLIAGRIILLISGLFYIGAVHRLAVKFFSPETVFNRLLIHALMTCATVQAIWFATYLLNPDLLASAVIFWYFVIVLEERTATHMRWSFLAGIFLGMAYLSKAYMLPFGLAQLVMMTASNLAFHRRLESPPQRMLQLTSFVSLIVGLGIVAGPWIAILSHKYDRLTFTNAGRANHANVGPRSFGQDPLWHPPLTRDYILEPVIAEEWSPFSSFENLRHQCRVILHNLTNCIGLIPGWLALSGLAFCLWFRHKQTASQHHRLQIAWWGLLTTAVYCSGYLMVNLETRYIVPVAAPLLCLSAAGFISVVAHESKLFGILDVAKSVRGEWRLAATAILVVMGFAAVDLYSIACVAIFHPQSTCMKQFRDIARQLDDAGIKDRLSASNRWHDGLYIAYARGNVSNYLGTPQASNPTDIADELLSSGVSLNYLWLEQNDTTSAEDQLQALAGGKDCVTILGLKTTSHMTEIIIR